MSKNTIEDLLETLESKTEKQEYLKKMYLTTLRSLLIDANNRFEKLNKSCNYSVRI